MIMLNIILNAFIILLVLNKTCKDEVIDITIQMDLYNEYRSIHHYTSSFSISRRMDWNLVIEGSMNNGKRAI